ncbi:MAG TPA: hypothetical protein VGK88_13360 [bacterium]|jgi:hypothetical protein
MAFDSRWEREHSTLQSQIRLLDGLDVGARRPPVHRPRTAPQIWLRLAETLRGVSARFRTLLAL